ncbi:MAG: C40 family peptidase [Paludibacteraceae bacterium]|nr:C40 family peptidase [Paludibacteraceae bacterium]
MVKAIALHSIVPMRAEAREGAEQTTQMLFGELCTILEEQPRWKRIKLDADGQEGWVDAKMISPMKPEEYKQYSAALKSAARVSMPMVYAMSENNNQTIPLTAGTRLTNYKDGHFEVLGVGFRIDSSMVIEKPLELNQPNLFQSVRFFLNTPYLWGGKNAMGMDCSGFTQVVMSLFGKQLLRNASEQATQGRKITNLQNAQTGDLVFFDHHDGKISHVGIVIDSGRVIHCSGRVKVEKLDETGIFNAEQGDYSHHLILIKRY